MIRALLDTNIILDIALKRVPFFDHSSKIFDKIDSAEIAGFVTASTITDIYYISGKESNKKQAKEFLLNLIQIIEIIGVDKEIIVEALKSEMKDFEDAVLATSANVNEIEYIITRNVNDFKGSNLKVFTPQEIITYMEERQK